MKKGASFNDPINGWDISRVESIEQMIQGDTAFKQDLSGWKTEQVTNMRFIMEIHMFSGATSFNQNLINNN